MLNFTLDLTNPADQTTGFMPMDAALASGAKVFRLATVEGPTVTVQLVQPSTHPMNGITTFPNGDLFLNVPYNYDTTKTDNGLNELQDCGQNWKDKQLSASSQAEVTATDGSSAILFSFKQPDVAA